MTNLQRFEFSGNHKYALPEKARPELTSGLMVLWRAHEYARDAEADRWEFAVEVQQFYDLGLTRNELRWLVAKGFADHGQENSHCGDALRSFEPNDGLTFSEISAFVLTESGSVFAAQVCADWLALEQSLKRDNARPVAESLSEPAEENGKPVNGKPSPDLKPSWDARRRKLFVGAELVKWFRIPASSQEAILSAFEEEAWPENIDDPLPGVADIVGKQRLLNAIKRLNTNQTNRLIHFYGDGTGRGIGWEPLSPCDTNGKEPEM